MRAIPFAVVGVMLLGVAIAHGAAWAALEGDWDDARAHREAAATWGAAAGAVIERAALAALDVVLALVAGAHGAAWAALASVAVGAACAVFGTAVWRWRSRVQLRRRIETLSVVRPGERARQAGLATISLMRANVARRRSA